MTKTELTRGTTFKMCVELQEDDGSAINLSGYTGEMTVMNRFNDRAMADAAVSIELPNKVTVELTPDITKTFPETNLYGTLQIENGTETILLEQFELQVQPNTNL